ncbi:MAG: AsmA family protein [Candidatus Rokubacteria bacterium]|nr:AsmA family protein [Candidatus Rokubacteria bacterium]
MSGRRVALLLGLAAVVAMALGLVALPRLVELPRVRALIAGETSRLLDRRVAFERLDLALFPLPSVVLTRLEVANAEGFSREPFLEVREARVRVRLLPLLLGRLEFGEVTLVQPWVLLERSGRGTWNLPAPGGGRPLPAAPLVAISRVALSDGSLTYRELGPDLTPVATYTVDRIDLGLRDLGWTTPLHIEGEARFAAGGVAVRFRGEAGPLSTVVRGLGELPLKADIRVAVEGWEGLPPLGALAVSGRGEGQLRLAGRLAHLSGGGRLDFPRLVLSREQPACPPPRGRSLVLDEVRLPVTVAESRLLANPVTLGVGGGRIAGELSLGWEGNDPVFRITGLVVRAVAAERLLVDYLCQPYAVTGPIDLTGEFSARGLGEAFWQSARGSGRLEVGPGRVVGPAALSLFTEVARVGGAIYSILNVDLPLSLFASPLEFKRLSASWRIEDGRVSTRDLRYRSRLMRIGGVGSYGLLDRRLDFDLAVETGRTAYTVKVGGTADQPTFRPIPRSILKGATDLLRRLLEGLPGRE